MRTNFWVWGSLAALTIVGAITLLVASALQIQSDRGFSALATTTPFPPDYTPVVVCQLFEAQVNAVDSDGQPIEDAELQLTLVDVSLNAPCSVEPVVFGGSAGAFRVRVYAVPDQRLQLTITSDDSGTYASPVISANYLPYLDNTTFTLQYFSTRIFG